MDGSATHAPRFRDATTILPDGDRVATYREKKGEGDWKPSRAAVPDVGSTPTRFRQILDDSIAFVGSSPFKVSSGPAVLYREVVPKSINWTEEYICEGESFVRATLRPLLRTIRQTGHGSQVAERVGFTLL
jgi:hypothetical protein